MYKYFQVTGGEEEWQVAPLSRMEEITAKHSPMFATVLSVDRIVDKSLSKQDLAKLKYAGPMYFDLDSPSIASAITNVNLLLDKLRDQEVDLSCLRIFASGGKGFHVEVPVEVFADPKDLQGVPHLPHIYKEIAFKLAVETLDFRVYSARRGRMWRQPNVRRENGKHKVPVTLQETRDMTEDSYQLLAASARTVEVAAPVYALTFAMTYAAAKQDVTTKLSKVSKKRPVALRGVKLPSMEALMEGRGIKDGVGFHEIAVQVSIYARDAGLSEDQMIEACNGLINTHVGDGGRYNTPSKREQELRRMAAYMEDNPCYDYSANAVKRLLSHKAPDIDGVPLSKEVIEAGIVEAQEASEVEEPGGIGEYDGVTDGFELTPIGAYVETEYGKQRICSVGFEDVHVMKGITNGHISGVECDITVNGSVVSRQALGLDVFSTQQSFDKFCRVYGHAFQGSEKTAKSLYMKVIDKGNKGGGIVYTTQREGLDILNIPHHENPTLVEPFLVWADANRVVIHPDAEGAGLNLRFHGYPDVRGNFKSDLSDAPPLITWLKEADNREVMRQAFHNLFKCQTPAVLGKLLGWSVSCFYRMLFHKVYGKFPLLHVNGQAGLGKTEMTTAIMRLFYLHQEPKMLTPSSTLFAVNQAASGSASIPLIVDEYKPAEMPPGMHDKFKLMFRDAYNCRDVQRGGGNKDNDDFKALSSSMLSAPMAFIAEAMEEEAALMERVVLVTLLGAPPVITHRRHSRFQAFREHGHIMAVLGQYIAAQIVRTYSVERLREEFAPMYEESRRRHMLQEEDLTAGLTMSQLEMKRSNRERTVYNYTVAQFGLRKFENLFAGIFGPDEFGDIFRELSDGIFSDMTDLAISTMPEWLKVMNSMATMSFQDPEIGTALRHGMEYQFGDSGGRATLEIGIRTAYAKYRAYMRNAMTKPMYPSEQAYLHALKSNPYLIESGGGTLQVAGGSHIFDYEALQRVGLQDWKASSRRR